MKYIFLSKQHFFFFTIMLCGIYTLAWLMQTNLFMNVDVNWLIHASQRLLKGGSYTKNFFETTPPLILFLNVPPIIVSKLCSVSIVLVFRLYIFLLASLSLFLCAISLRQIFPPPQTFFISLYL